MQFLYLRRFYELILLTVLPSIIASAIVQADRFQGLLFYPILVIVSVICTIIFFGGNGLMMRRMARDIKSKKTFYAVQTFAFLIYTISITLICVFRWTDMRTALFFHARVFEVICDPIVVDPDDLSKNLLTPTNSIIISTTLYGLMTYLSYPFFKKRYEKEKIELQKQKEEDAQILEQEKVEYEKSVENAYMGDLFEDEEEDEEDNTPERAYEPDRLYTVKELRKMEKMERASAPVRRGQRINWSRKKTISANSANDIKRREQVKNYILNFGSYSFYQMIITKQQKGEYIGLDISKNMKQRFSIRGKNRKG